MTPEELSTFARAMRALAPYLDDLVLAGGWAHRLFRHHPWASPGTGEPIATLDADIVAPRRLANRGSRIDHLLQQAGFREEVTGEGTPPTTKYYAPPEAPPFYVEFIAARLGGARSGGAVNVLGVTAQRLRYVGLLTIDPWRIRLEPALGLPQGHEDLEVRVANPVTYLFQKVLILESRPVPAKRAKDALYVYETLVLMAPSLAKMREHWDEIAEEVPVRTVKEFRRLRDRIFHGPSDLLRRAADIARATGRANPPDAGQIAQACRVGLSQAFP